MPQHENGEKGRLESREKPNHCRWPILAQRPRPALYLWVSLQGPILCPFPPSLLGKQGKEEGAALTRAQCGTLSLPYALHSFCSA